MNARRPFPVSPPRPFDAPIGGTRSRGARSNELRSGGTRSDRMRSGGTSRHPGRLLALARAVIALSTVALPLTASSLMPPPLAAQPAPPPRLAALDDSVRALVAGRSPGVAIGIVRQGEVVHTFYGGLADLSHDVPVDARARFNIASNAKQYTAAVVLSLVLEGRLTFDATLQTLLPDALPRIGSPITVAQLITHTSGLRDVYDLWSLAGVTWWQSMRGNPEALELLRAQRALNAAPGSEYRYSNSNYLLLAELVRAVTDSSFAEVSADRFRRWGMPHTAFQTSGMEVIPHRTRPYGRFEEWQEYPAVTGLHGDGGLFTTLPDQLAWEQRLQRAERSAEGDALLRRSQQPVPGVSSARYGHGLEFGTYAGLPWAFHDGSTGAYNATFLRVPSRQLAVVVMSNNGTIGVHALAMRYLDAMLAGSVALDAAYPAGPPRIGPAVDVTPWLGDYRAETGALITLARTDSGLVRRIPGAPDVRLLPDTGNVYRYATNAALKMALDRDSVGSPRFTIYLPTQLPNEGRRLPPSTPLPPTAWLGRFVNDETGAELTVLTVNAERVTAQLNGRSVSGLLARADLLAIGGHEWQPVRGASGRVERLLLDGERIRRVAFERQP